MFTKIIVGLGNPGIKYDNTRHNVGFLLVDAWVLDLGLAFTKDNDFNALITKNSNYLFVKPLTFMNLSGETVAKVVNYYNLVLEDLIIVHDDVDLEWGKTKFQFGASSAGHHGVENIIEKLGSKEFWRFRVGIGRPNDNKYQVENYVLSKLSSEDLAYIKNIELSIL